MKGISTSQPSNLQCEEVALIGVERLGVESRIRLMSQLVPPMSKEMMLG